MHEEASVRGIGEFDGTTGEIHVHYGDLQLNSRKSIKVQYITL